MFRAKALFQRVHVLVDVSSQCGKVTDGKSSVSAVVVKISTGKCYFFSLLNEIFLSLNLYKRVFKIVVQQNKHISNCMQDDKDVKNLIFQYL